jgi:hypothetical protein
MRFLILTLLFHATSLFAANDFTVQTMQFKGSNSRGEKIGDGDITMPYLVSSNKHIAALINDRVFIAQFNVLAPNHAGKFFSPADGVQIEGIANQAFSIDRQDEQILSISFDVEGCGAYCETYSLSYNFEAFTGRLIQLPTLLTHTGAMELSKRFQKQKISQYREQLVNLKKELKETQKKKNKESTEIVNDLLDRIALNTDCLAQAQNADTTKNNLSQLLTLRFQLFEKEVKLESGRCSNHAMRALDDVGNISLSIPYTELRPILANYGKNILFGETLDVAQHPAPMFSQVLYGKIGTSEITMILENSPGQKISGMYFYNKYRKPIQLTGALKNGSLVLEELSEDANSSNSKIQLKQIGQRLEGNWIGKKQLRIELSIP